MNGKKPTMILAEKTMTSPLASRTLRFAPFLALFVGGMAATLAGCGNEEQGFCFPDGDCNAANQGGASNSFGGGGKGGSGGGVIVTGGSGGGINPMGGGGKGGAAGGGSCDTSSPKSCGTCDNDCTKKVGNVVSTESGKSPITCTVTTPGQPGLCGYDKTKAKCADDYYDIDGKPENGCEYGPCKKTAAKDDVCDSVDNDCDGKIDDEVDFCSPKSCGSCKDDCTTKFPNADGVCTKTDANGTCAATNVKCEFKGKCADGYFDADGKSENGCEYKCTPTDLDGKPLPAGQTAVEFCGDNIDNDCDGKIDVDDPDTQTAGKPESDPRLGKECTNGDKGECFAQKGTTSCTQNGLICVGSPKPGELPEVCNGKDDDCNDFIDDALTDLGACGNFSLGRCKKGQASCEQGAKTCLGEITPEEETCNNVDDDCDDIIDGTAPPGGNLQPCALDAECPAGQFCRPLDSDNSKKVCALPTKSEGGSCEAATGPCLAKVEICNNAVLECVKPANDPHVITPDKCGEDSNCNGVLENQPDTQNDPANCGACGNDCNAGSDHLNWTCQNGVCKQPTDPATKCQLGYIDCDGNANDCERACTFLSNQEVCNGVDDNCDCSIDESKDATHPNGVVTPTADQVCGVASNSPDPACAPKSALNPGGIEVKCNAGKFECVFNQPAGHCDQGNPPSCAATPDDCDGLDNDCNGSIDDNFKPPIKTSDALGVNCASDDGKPSDGECRATGTYVCSPDKKSTVCSVSAPLKCGVAPGDPTFNQKPCDEVCDGKDNDCDGLIDEPRLGQSANPFAAGARPDAKGSGAGYLKPAVVKIGDSLWIHKYEVSRPSATPTTAGQGNGYWGGADTPANIILNKTPACNEPVDESAGKPGRVPWFNITPLEVEQTCNNMGGRICRLSEWQAACKVNGIGAAPPAPKNCSWGYKNNCSSSSATTCNLGAFDFDTSTAGNQDGLLPTASSKLTGCFADWTGLFTNGTGPNPAGETGIFDITGNLREITIVDSTVGQPLISNRQYALMGGAFNNDEGGGSCDASFYTVNSSFQLFSVGFRCCFDEYPD